MYICSRKITTTTIIILCDADTPPTLLPSASCCTGVYNCANSANSNSANGQVYCCPSFNSLAGFSVINGHVSCTCPGTQTCYNTYPPTYTPINNNTITTTAPTTGAAVTTSQSTTSMNYYYLGTRRLAFMRACACVSCLYVCVCVCVCVYVCMHACMYVCMFLYVCMFICMYVCTCVCMYVCMCTRW